jgi:hypothetical protein
MFGISEDRWIDIVTVSSVLAAAGFGMLGLFSEFKVDGKITRSGRLAAGGIALSAMLSILLGVLQDRNDARDNRERNRRADTERAEQKQRFYTQALAFADLTGRMTSLVGTQKTQLGLLAEQNGVQQALLARTTGLLQSTNQLGLSQESNTGRMLRWMWNDTNRVVPSAFAAMIQVTCPKSREALAESEDPIEAIFFDRAAFPKIFNSSWAAMLEYSGAGASGDSGAVLLAQDPRPVVALQSGAEAQTLDPVEIVSFTFNALNNGSKDDATEKMAPITSWVGRTLTLRLMGTNAGFAERVAKATHVPIGPRLSANRFSELEDFPHAVGGRTAVRVSACQARMVVLLHSRVVAESQGRIYEMLPGLYSNGEFGPMSDADRQRNEARVLGFLAIAFDPVTIPRDALPHFAN